MHTRMYTVARKQLSHVAYAIVNVCGHRMELNKREVVLCHAFVSVGWAKVVIRNTKVVINK